jgi:transposase
MRKQTIGMDLGDRTSRYCILNEEGDIVFEGSVPTTKSGMNQVFGAMPRCRVAMETGSHSPWVSRQLSGFGHEVIVANARNVRLICESTRKDDRLDAKTLARLARIDPLPFPPMQYYASRPPVKASLTARYRSALTGPARDAKQFAHRR